MQGTNPEEITKKNVFGRCLKCLYCLIFWHDLDNCDINDPAFLQNRYHKRKWDEFTKKHMLNLYAF